jgi:N-acetylglucosamine-6-phosphate deacetylase
MPVQIAFEPLTQRTRKVVYDHERVFSLTDCDSPAGELFAMPGFCDLQVNGAYGIDINAPDLTTEKLHQLCERFLAEGITAWLPTVITAAPAAICRQLQILRNACDADALCAACIPGFHLEGPFLSPVEGARGAHDPAFVLPPDWELFEQCQTAAGGRIRIVTLAPEVAGAIPFIERLCTAGVIPAIGHSLADEDQLHAAIQAGARLSTHLGNGLPAMLPRHANPMLAQMAADALHASVIFDGHHLPASLRRILLRAKGMERLILISDATRLAGMAPGIYDEAVGGRVELHANGRLSLFGTPYLAGAARTLKQNVEFALQADHLQLADVLRMAVENPRNFLQLRQESLVLFTVDPGTSTITIQLTALQGRIYAINHTIGASL